MFIIEFIAVITGNPKETACFFDRIQKSVQLLTSTETEKQVKQDVKVKKALQMTQSLIDNKSVFSNESFESLLSDHMMPMPNDSPDQHHKFTVNQEHQLMEAKIKELQKNINNAAIWERMTTAFKTLTEPRRKESKYLSSYFITEQSLRSNFSKLFEDECDIFARILYLKMSNNKDHARINFIQFIKVFQNLLDEIKDQRNRVIFGLLDINEKGVLDIVMLMQLFNNVNRNTMFGQEILKIVREYKSKNVLLKGGYRRKIVLNFSTFVKLVNHSCLIEQL